MLPLIAGALTALVVVEEGPDSDAVGALASAFMAGSLLIQASDGWQILQPSGAQARGASLASYTPLIALAALLAAGGDAKDVAYAAAKTYTVTSLLIHSGTDWVT